MGIELWSRREGIVNPPATLLHAEPGTRGFPPGFRTRINRWTFDAFRNLQWGTSMGDVINEVPYTTLSFLHDLSAAYGRDPLTPLTGHPPPALQQLQHHVLTCVDIEVLDYVDAVIQKTASLAEEFSGRGPDEERIAGLNRILREEGIGYRHVDGRLVRFDGELTHAEAIVPALAALATGRFGEAEREFDEALIDFGRGAYRGALTNANAAFESVLKVVTGKEGVAGDLIKVARSQGLIPKYLGSSVENFEKLMHGLPATRAQEGSAHGLGTRVGEADERLARLVVTMAAALITFLADDGTG